PTILPPTPGDRNWAQYYGFTGNLPPKAEPYQFLGIEGGLCDGTSDEGWVDFDIELQIREWCTDVAQVVNEAGENKAWSGRLNQKPQVESSAVPTLPDFRVTNADEDHEDFVAGLGSGIGFIRKLYGDQATTTTMPFTFKQNNAPYGSIVPPADTLYDPEKWDSRIDTEKDEFTGESRTVEPGIQPIYVEAANKQVRAGSPYSCSGSPTAPDCIFPPVPDGQISLLQTSDKPFGNAVVALRNIFVKIFKWWRWDEIANQYSGVSALPGIGFDLTAGDPGECPVIQSVRRDEGDDDAPELFNSVAPDPVQHNRVIDRYNCGSELAPGTGGIRNFGRYSINGNPIAHSGQAKDPGEPNEPITSISVGQEMKLEFYGFNFNGEQLPLRKITIDWTGENISANSFDIAAGADRGEVTVISGNFKNHRSDCDDRGDNYGQTRRACDNSPFVFTHVYQQAGSVSPIVILEDNWGKKTRASYNTATPVMIIDHLNLDIPQPDELSASPAEPERGTTVTFSWEPPQAAAKFDPADITGYEYSVKKNYQNTSLNENEKERLDASADSFVVQGEQDLKSIAFEVRTCTDKGCGVQAASAVAFRPPQVGSIDTSPSIPVFDMPLDISWTQTPLADSYQLSITKTGGASQPNIPVFGAGYTYAHESGVTAVQ
ncbi:MAG: hypothetical protein U1C18_00615, partial [Patescibacteria group bacterium]|nr:hypothetical protein [Patescibacteria group bacterium]